jgi:hypothetical protein
MMPNSRSYRVELRTPGKVRMLGRMPYARPHFRALDPFVSRLVRDGQHGWLMLVDEETNGVVARRRLGPFGTSNGGTESPAR